MKIYAAQINLTVGDISGNAEKIITHIKKAAKEKADIAVFPELAITGYSPQDLLMRQSFIEEEQAALKKIAAATKDVQVIIGATYSDKFLHNAAYLLKNGKAQLISGKADLPNYGVFDEKRYFKPLDTAKTFTIKGKKIGVIVCEDSWTPAKTALYKKQKVDFLISINASPFESGKLQRRINCISKRAQEAKAGIFYLNLLGAQDGVVFDGGSFELDKTGKLITQLPQFEEVGAITSGKAKALDASEEKYKAMVLGLKDYLAKNGFKKVLLGLSGGMDSALVAAIAVDAIGADNVRAVLLPSRYTSKSSNDDANKLAKILGIKAESIAIEPAFKAFNEMLAANFKGKKADITEENLQSRIRGVTLMAISNKHNELLLTTGNKSEIAVGYSTLYGDSNGAFNPIKDLYKTEVYEVAKWRGNIPTNIHTKAPSAELRPGQTDQDSLPDYDTLDAILKLLIEKRKSIKDIVKKGYKQPVVEKVAALLYRAEYKRFQSAPGVKLTAMSFGNDWRYPLTNKFYK